MGAEIECAPKLALYIVEPIDQPCRDFGQKEVVAGESGGGAIAVPANRVAIEDGHRHDFYMTPLALPAKPAPRLRRVGAATRMLTNRGKGWGSW